MLALSSSAGAGQYSSSCSNAGKFAQSQCRSAIIAMNNTDASSAVAKSSASSRINPGAGTQTSQIAEQIGRLITTKTTCDTAKKQCESRCDQAKRSAESNQLAGSRGVPAQVAKKKESDCTIPMSSLISQIDQALENLRLDQTETSSTASSSNSSPFTMPTLMSPTSATSSESPPTTESGTETTSSSDTTTEETSVGEAAVKEGGEAGFATAEPSGMTSADPIGASGPVAPVPASPIQSNDGYLPASVEGGNRGSAPQLGTGKVALPEQEPIKKLSDLPKIFRVVPADGGGGGGPMDNVPQNEKTLPQIGAASIFPSVNVEQPHQATDVSKQYGPSLFNLSSQAVQSWCQKALVCSQR